MNDRQVPLDMLMAWSCWGIGTLLIVGDVLDILWDEVGLIGIAVLAFGHLQTMQALMCRKIAEEREIFQMGRDSVRHIR